jgi:hypothetical protein
MSSPLPHRTRKVYNIPVSNTYMALPSEVFMTNIFSIAQAA